MEKAEHLAIEHALFSWQKYFLWRFKNLLESPHFEEGKKFGDWECFINAEGQKGMRSATVTSNGPEPTFSLRTEIVYLSEDVVLLTSETRDSIYSVVYHSDTTESAETAHSFLEKVNAKLKDKTTNVKEGVSDSAAGFIFIPYLFMLNKELNNFFGGEDF
jgi:hypothetical protein